MSLVRRHRGTANTLARYFPYARAAGQLVGRGLRSAIRPAAVRNRNPGRKNAKRAKVGDGDVMTNQFDTKLVYRRGKRKSKRVVRRWKKFKAKVNKVINSDISSNVAFFNESLRVASIAGSQGYEFKALGNIWPSAVSSTVDIASICQDYLFGNIPATGQALGGVQKKIMFTSGIMDVAFRNVTGDGTTMMLDVYTLVPKTDLTNTQCQNWDDMWSQSFNFTGAGAQVAPPPVGTPVSLLATTPGVGPFQSPRFCRFVTVLEKRRFILTDGQTATMQLSANYKKFGYKTADWWLKSSETKGTVAKKGFTKCYMACFYGLGSDSAATAATSFPAVTLSCIVTKSISFKIQSNRSPTNEADTNVFYAKYTDED